MTISSTDQAAAARTATGVAYGLTAYLCWGFFPIYFKQLAHVPPLEVLAHRCVWALVTLAVLLAGSGGWGLVRVALRDRRQLLILSVTTVLIATNLLVDYRSRYYLVTNGAAVMKGGNVLR